MDHERIKEDGNNTWDEMGEKEEVFSDDKD